MKRSIRTALVALPLITLAVATTYADVKTRDRTTVKFEGPLGIMFRLGGGGKPAEGSTAVKGNRKSSIKVCPRSCAYYAATISVCLSVPARASRTYMAKPPITLGIWFPMARADW